MSLTVVAMTIRTSRTVIINRVAAPRFRSRFCSSCWYPCFTCSDAPEEPKSIDWRPSLPTPFSVSLSLSLSLSLHCSQSRSLSLPCVSASSSSLLLLFYVLSTKQVLLPSKWRNGRMAWVRLDLVSLVALLWLRSSLGWVSVFNRLIQQQLPSKFGEPTHNLSTFMHAPIRKYHDVECPCCSICTSHWT